MEPKREEQSDELINIPEDEVLSINPEGELVRRVDTLSEYVDEWIIKQEAQILASLAKPDEPEQEVITMLRRVCECDVLFRELNKKNKEFSYFFLTAFTWILQSVLYLLDSSNPNYLPNTDEFTLAFIVVFVVAFSLSVKYSDSLGDLGNQDVPEELARLRKSLSDKKWHVEMSARGEGLIRHEVDADKIQQELSSSLQRNFPDFYQRYVHYAAEEEKKKKKKNELSSSRRK